MKFSKPNKKFFLGIVALITIGVVFGYYVTRRESKTTADPIGNNHAGDDSVTNVNNEPTSNKIGAKPETDQKDGSIKIVEEFVKSHAQNPSTFEFLEWSEIS